MSRLVTIDRSNGVNRLFAFLAVRCAEAEVRQTSTRLAACADFLGKPCRVQGIWEQNHHASMYC